MDTTSPSLIGMQLGRYRVESRLGAGGMGEVYRAFDVELHRPVALKTLRPEVAMDHANLERFFAEARAANVIRHEHIIEYTDMHKAAPGGLSYVVMELCEGRTLTRAIRDIGRLPPARASFILAQVADALEAAHRAGIVHRDLKPDNVFLIRRMGTDDYVKVLDFGVARLRPDLTRVEATQSGVIIGTPAYMSPEQCKGEKVTPAADIYALGVILFQALTGQLPFDGPTMPMMLVAHMTSEPPPVHALVPDVPYALSMLVQQALAKHPAERPATMAAMRAAMLAAVGLEGLIATSSVPAQAPMAPAQPYTPSAPSAPSGAPAGSFRTPATPGTAPGGTLDTAPAPISTIPARGQAPPQQGLQATMPARGQGPRETPRASTGPTVSGRPDAPRPQARAATGEPQPDPASPGGPQGTPWSQASQPPPAGPQGTPWSQASQPSTGGPQQAPWPQGTQPSGVGPQGTQPSGVGPQGTPSPYQAAQPSGVGPQGTPLPQGTHPSASGPQGTPWSQPSHPGPAPSAQHPAFAPEPSELGPATAPPRGHQRPATPAPTIGPRPREAPGSQPGSRPGRRWVVPAAITALLLAAGGGGLWAVYKPGDSGTPSGNALVAAPDAAAAAQPPPDAAAVVAAPDPRADLDALSAAHGEPAAPAACQTGDAELLARLVRAATLLQGGAPDGRRPQDVEAVRLLAAPDHTAAEYWYWLARARLFADANVAAVAEAAERAIAACPDYAAAHNAMGSALFRDHPADAVRAYAQAVTLAPRFAGARFNLGLAQLQQGQLEAALGSLTAVIDDPEAGALRTTALLTRGQAHLMAREPARAIPDLEAARAAAPDDARTLFLLGQAYELAGKPDDARDAMCKASALGHPQAAERCPP
jgi:serine/threonine-protein kinase